MSRQPPPKKWLIYFVWYSCQTSTKNKVKCDLPSWWKKKFFSFCCELVTLSWYTLWRHHRLTCQTLFIFPLFGAVGTEKATHDKYHLYVRTSRRMKPVFIQSWTMPRKYLRSANLPIAKSQMAAMKMSVCRGDWKGSAQDWNNDAFTGHCGISLNSPNTLHQKYTGSLKKSFSFYLIGKAAPSLVQFSFRRYACRAYRLTQWQTRDKLPTQPLSHTCDTHSDVLLVKLRPEKIADHHENARAEL